MVLTVLTVLAHYSLEPIQGHSRTRIFFFFHLPIPRISQSVVVVSCVMWAINFSTAWNAVYCFISVWSVSHADLMLFLPYL